MVKATISALAFAAALLAQSQAHSADSKAPPSKKIQALIITGRDDHDWRGATALMREFLDAANIFEVRTTEEFRDAGIAALDGYDVVVLVYNDKAAADQWSDRSKRALLDFVHGGKGLVVYHHTVAGFQSWAEFGPLCGGNYYKGAQHGPIHEFTVDIADRDHPITKGLKKSFLQGPDELYASMSMQPEGSYHLLATAWDDHALYNGRSRTPLVGPGKDEPVMWTVQSGSGRVFATMLGHSAKAVRGDGFRYTFVRGVEWAATGNVTQPTPPEMKE